MEKLAVIIGIVAVVLYVLGYLQKTRKNIIVFNLTSRILYILQYLLLGAYEGAAMDVLGSISSVLAGKKETPFIKKHLKLLLISINILIIIAGLKLYRNIYSLAPILGVILHTTAFWIDDEKTIRKISLIGSPFWLLYNFVSGAYGSLVGDIFSIVSLIIAMIKYDYRKSEADV